MRLNKICFFICVIITVTSCKKVLDTQPYNALSDLTAFATPERALLALHGVYDAAQSGLYNGSIAANRGYPFGAAYIQQGDNRGEDVVNIAAFYQITYQATYNTTTLNNVNMWTALYALINKANVAIDGFRKASGGTLTTAVATQYEAECRFLRAMAHHEALIHFARPYRDGNGNKIGVPYRDFAVNSGELVDLIRSTPRKRVDSVYIGILSDLDFAETNLPAAKYTSRATKAAAIALKMRVKLHMGDWAGVITEGNKLVPAAVTPANPSGTISPIGGFALSASPDGPFIDNFSANNASLENIFSIRNDPSDHAGNNGAIANMYGASNLAGRGLVALSPILWNNTTWKCDDKRRTLLFAQGTGDGGGTAIFTTKYRDYVNKGDWAPQLRYAEVLLTLAEAEARNSATISQRAIDLLNVVRNRSLATPATQQYTLASFATKIELVAAILFERRIEFAMEGKRWADIHRNAVDPDFTTGGIPAKIANGTTGAALYGCGVAVNPTQAAIPYSDFRFLWPIPDDERTSNPIVEQNPGY